MTSIFLPCQRPPSAPEAPGRTGGADGDSALSAESARGASFASLVEERRRKPETDVVAAPVDGPPPAVCPVAPVPAPTGDVSGSPLGASTPAASEAEAAGGAPATTPLPPAIAVPAVGLPPSSGGQPFEVLAAMPAPVPLVAGADGIAVSAAAPEQRDATVPAAATAGLDPVAVLDSEAASAGRGAIPGATLGRQPVDSGWPGRAPAAVQSLVPAEMQLEAANSQPFTAERMVAPAVLPEAAGFQSTAPAPAADAPEWLGLPSTRVAADAEAALPQTGGVAAALESRSQSAPPGIVTILSAESATPVAESAAADGANPKSAAVEPSAQEPPQAVPTTGRDAASSQGGTLPEAPGKQALGPSEPEVRPAAAGATVEPEPASVAAATAEGETPAIEFARVQAERRALAALGTMALEDASRSRLSLPAASRLLLPAVAVTPASIPEPSAALQPPVPVAASVQVGEEIVHMAQIGRQRAEIELDPPELGRVRLRLEVRDRTLTGTIQVERAGVFNALQTELPALMGALDKAGIQCKHLDIQLLDPRRGQERRDPRHPDAQAEDETADERAAAGTSATPRPRSGTGLVDYWL